jgi:hypothetical protein
MICLRQNETGRPSAHPARAWWVALVWFGLLSVCASAETLRADALRIVTGDGATPTERFAADELARYLRAMGLEVDADAGTPIEVGRHASRANAGLADELKGPLNGIDGDAFAVVVEPTRVRVVGGGDRGTLYAAYALLERLGCRFFGPGELFEVVPRRDTFELPLGEMVERPTFLTREIDGGSVGAGADLPAITRAGLVDLAVKQRLNRAFAAREDLVRRDEPGASPVWPQRGGMQRWQWITHNFPFIFPPDQKWFERHPEYFALYQGRRVAPGSGDKAYYGGGNLATTNPDVIAHCERFVRDWFAAHDDGLVVPLWPNDGAILWDESPEALAMGGRNFTPGPQGSMTRRMVTFVNTVAERVYDAYPDRLVLLPAYQNYRAPLDAGEVTLSPNIFVQYCYHGDYAKGPLQSAHNAAAAEEMRRWAEQAPHFGVWEYFLIGDFGDTAVRPVLLPLLTRSRDTVRFLHDLGATRYFTQANRAYQPHNTLLFAYLARLLWDPSTEVEPFVRDYAGAMFGERAGPHVAAFYLAAEDAVQQSDWAPRSYAEVVSPSAAVFTDAVVATLEAHLAAAEAQPMDALQRRRLAVVRDAWDATVAGRAASAAVATSADTPWRLERRREAYVMNADGDPASAERLRQLEREALDRGDWTPALGRLVFRGTRREEPVVTLRGPALEVAVVPGLGGRVVRLIDRYDGHNYLHESPNGDTLEAIGAAYFAYGGYEAYVGHGFAGPGWEQAFEIVAQDATSITMRTEGPGWRLERAVALGGNHVAVTDTLTNTSGVEQKLSWRGHPVFDLGPGVGGVPVRSMGAGDAPGKLVPVVDATARALHDRRFPIGAYWSATNPQTERQITLVLESTSGPLEGYVFVDDAERYVQLETFGPSVGLEPRASWSITQKWYPELTIEQVRSAADAGMTPAAGHQVRHAVADGADDEPVDAGDGFTVERGSPPTAAGMLEGFFRVDAAGADPQWLMSFGDNVPDWFYVVVEDGVVNWTVKRGRAPYRGPDDAYISLRGPFEPADHGDGLTRVAVGWAVGADGLAAMRLWVGDRVVAERFDAPWPAGWELASLWVGRSSASAAGRLAGALGEVRVHRLPWLRDAIGDEASVVWSAAPQGGPRIPGAAWMEPAVGVDEAAGWYERLQRDRE